MWCRHCQQDVPAARDVAGPAACSRCQRAFKAASDGAQPALKLAAVADCGVSLEEFDRALQPAPALARPTLVADADDLRRLERLLRPQLRSDFGHGQPVLREPATPGLGQWSPTGAIEGPCVRVEPLDIRGASYAAYAQRSRSAWGVNLLLAIGAATFAVGVGLLMAANMLVHAVAWRWGFAMTIAGEGLLIGGLAAMAVRLWRNSRRINSQLESIDRRLGDVQASIGHADGGATFFANSLWRVDAGEPLGRFERSAVAVR
jgi:hypothetical protein